MHYKNKRLFVGVSGFGTIREVFHSTCPDETHPAPTYDYVMGPFETRRGADWFAAYGVNNPHVVTVMDAERIAKQNFGVFGQWAMDQGYMLNEQGVVTSPGRFEAEPFATVVYWDLAMCGDADEQWGDEEIELYFVFHVNPKERRWYNLPDYTRHVVIWQTDSGFVIIMSCMDDKEFTEFLGKLPANLVLAEDGYADGGEPYTDEELALINSN